MNLLSYYDIICLIETWSNTTDEFDNIFQEHSCFSQVHERRSSFGRHPGGICVFIRKSLLHCFTRVPDETGQSIFLIFHKRYSLLSKNILYCFCYIFPENSRHYEDLSETNRIVALENSILIICTQIGDMELYLSGDFNARIGNDEEDFITDDTSDYLPCDLNYENDNFCVNRTSKDSFVNRFGKSLLSLCRTLNVHVLNGRSDLDQHGEYTFVSHLGKSVIDYMIVSTNLFQYASTIPGYI